MTLQKWSTHQKTRRGQTSHLPNIHWELGKFQQSNQSLFGSQKAWHLAPIASLWSQPFFVIYRWDLIKTPAPQAADPLQPAETLRSGLLNRAECQSPELWNVHGRGHLFSVWDLPITIPIRRSSCHQQGRLKGQLKMVQHAHLVYHDVLAKLLSKESWGVRESNDAGSANGPTISKHCKHVHISQDFCMLHVSQVPDI